MGGNQKAKSPTVENNHNPVWNFKTTFYVDQNTGENITIAVFDEDLGKDDSLGSKSINVMSIQKQKQLLNQWITLEKCKSGEVLISAEFIPEGGIKAKNNVIEGSLQTTVEEPSLTKTDEKKQIEKVLESTTSVPVVQSKKILQEGQLLIMVYKARDIEKKGMFGKADPYVKLTLGKQETKSATVKNNHNPEWNLKATFTVDQNTNEKLTIAVFDEDLGKDDSLGIATLDLSSIQNCRKLENEWIPLEKCKSGEILLSAEFIPSANIQTESKKKTIQEIAPKKKIEGEEPKEDVQATSPLASKHKKIMEKGQIVITVYKAKDIEKKGMFGKADPYIKMTLGKQKAKSATVKDNHNPEWNFKAT